VSDQLFLLFFSLSQSEENESKLSYVKSVLNKVFSNTVARTPLKMTVKRTWNVEKVFVDGAEPGALLEVDVAQTLQTMVQTWLIFFKNLKDFYILSGV